jgi:hypothetical protein
MAVGCRPAGEGGVVPGRLSVSDAGQRDSRGLSACCVKARACRYDRLSVNDAGQRHGRACVCLDGRLEDGAGVPVRLSVNDAGHRNGRAGVCLGGWLEEGAGVPVRGCLNEALLL